MDLVLEVKGHYRFIFGVTIILFLYSCKTYRKNIFWQINYMSFSTKAAFGKSANCPMSSDLLAFQNGEISLRERERIIVHLRFCEFCEAEVEFYARYPQPEETIEKTEIPPPLYELAEALLNNRHKGYFQLNKLLNETSELKFQKS